MNPTTPSALRTFARQGDPENDPQGNLLPYKHHTPSVANMVLRKFQTNALQRLCTEEQLDLLNSIDSLRSQGISHYISLPQIIVCGDQSSGKSSVLEAISGVSFPVKSSLCTRFPTELVLRKSVQVGVRISIVPHHSRSDIERDSLGNFCEQLEDFEGLPALIDNAKAIMGITTYGKAFSNNLLRVEVSGPDRPHLTIVDLPGLIHSETKQQSFSDIQLVQEVVRTYMKEPRNIIFAVISARNDFANQIVLKLARDADKSGNRTLGVITKPDTLVPGSESESMFLSLAKNQDVEFRLGWYVLKNMNTEKGDWTLADRDREEMLFFSAGAWEDLPRSFIGVDSLRSRLSKVLLGQITAELPSLIKEIREKADNCRSEIMKLGEPRTSLDEQRSYLLHISQSFQSLVKAAVDGTYNDPFFGYVHVENGLEKRLRAVIQNLNEQFADRISRRGHYRRLCEESITKQNSNDQIRITRAEYTAYIGSLLRKTRGRELPGTFNPMIVRDLFLEQCGPWEKLTRSHIKNVWSSARDFLVLAVRYIADNATSTALVDGIIFPIFDSIWQQMEQKTTELLVLHKIGHPITYNHYFTENLQKIRAERREGELGKIIGQFFGVNDLHEPYFTERSIDLNQLLQSLLRQSEPDMVNFASAEALDCMLAYYKVALKRFVNDIANEAVESKLMMALLNIFSPVAVFNMHGKMVTQIAGESEENSTLRDQLNRKLQVLNRGSETCQQFVGVGGYEAKIVGMSGQPSSTLHDIHVDPEDEVQSVTESSNHSLEREHTCAEPEPIDDEELKLVSKTAETNSSNKSPEAIEPHEFSFPVLSTTSTRKSKKISKKGNNKKQDGASYRGTVVRGPGPKNGQRYALVKARNVDSNAMFLLKMRYQLNPERFDFVGKDEILQIAWDLFCAEVEAAKLLTGRHKDVARTHSGENAPEWLQLIQQHPSYLNYDVRTNKLYLVDLAGLGFTDPNSRTSCLIDEESPYVEAFNLWRAPYKNPEKASEQAAKTPSSDKPAGKRPPSDFTKKENWAP
ncbi:P-loop containing nucleoside triphosphate hydrolase protein [Aspergillus affinis]|uniref:P-loop containing nucleoside triphosphate hydrolase protein n=1 Tax=Aspergillus affinis TaxID=1070780 RepID=UPI0022FEAE46|nr:P-loop containing nucleoside triphosphate hydrolase protein [Aspergillus affinis]KAI9039398.1 P-loop containing nucleoside triphosphate hydrolase protein [Aspergillus affinis]